MIFSLLSKGKISFIFITHIYLSGQSIGNLIVEKKHFISALLLFSRSGYFLFNLPFFLNLFILIYIYSTTHNCNLQFSYNLEQTVMKILLPGTKYLWNLDLPIRPQNFWNIK